jgi:hypothetical protein
LGTPSRPQVAYVAPVHHCMHALQWRHRHALAPRLALFVGGMHGACAARPAFSGLFGARCPPRIANACPWLLVLSTSTSPALTRARRCRCAPPADNSMHPTATLVATCCVPLVPGGNTGGAPHPTTLAGAAVPWVCRWACGLPCVHGFDPCVTRRIACRSPRPAEHWSESVLGRPRNPIAVYGGMHALAGCKGQRQAACLQWCCPPVVPSGTLHRSLAPPPFP